MTTSNENVNQGESWGPTQGYQTPQAPQVEQGMYFQGSPKMVQHAPGKMASFDIGSTIAGLLQILSVLALVLGLVLMVGGNSSDFSMGIVMAAGAVPVFILASIWQTICKIGNKMFG